MTYYNYETLWFPILNKNTKFSDFLDTNIVIFRVNIEISKDTMYKNPHNRRNMYSADDSGTFMSFYMTITLQLCFSTIHKSRSSVPKLQITNTCPYLHPRLIGKIIIDPIPVRKSATIWHNANDAKYE